MSADNFLLSLPAANGRAALYDVSASDAMIDLTAPLYTYADYVRRNYENRLVGHYNTTAEVEAAAVKYMSDTIVEYGLHFRHERR